MRRLQHRAETPEGQVLKVLANQSEAESPVVFEPEAELLGEVPIVFCGQPRNEVQQHKSDERNGQRTHPIVFGLPQKVDILVEPNKLLGSAGHGRQTDELIVGHVKPRIDGLQLGQHVLRIGEVPAELADEGKLLIVPGFVVGVVSDVVDDPQKGENTNEEDEVRGGDYAAADGEQYGVDFWRSGLGGWVRGWGYSRIVLWCGHAD